MKVRILASLLLGSVWVSGCDDGGQAADATAGETTGATDDGGTTTSTPDPTTGTTTGPGTGDTGCGFICPEETGGITLECDPWLQDCEAGQKCMPWADDGGNAWNATRCTDLDDSPVAPGDTCSVEGSGVSGVDNCELGAMCWDVDGETNEGTCVAFCQGTAMNPQCDDPDASCSILNDGALILCLPECDPLLSGMDCNEGQGCYPLVEGFGCVPDASGPDDGVAGDPCEFLNACDPGLFCINAAAVAGCQGALGCCSPACDLSDPGVNDTCPGSGQGEECVPWFDPDAVPPGFEDVGACGLPA